MQTTGGETSWIPFIPECPSYYPSVLEFQDPLKYVEKIYPEAKIFGICKIIPPVIAEKNAETVLLEAGLSFQSRFQPLKASSSDKEHAPFFHNPTKYSFHDFKEAASQFSSKRRLNSPSLSLETLEKKFWQEMNSSREDEVEYASDIDGTAFSSSPLDPLGSTPWNLTTFPKLPDSLLRFLDQDIPGVSEPMLYIGMLFSWFAWHVEDHYLASINFHHMGAPKTWYGLSSTAAASFESLAHHLLSPGKPLSATYRLLRGKTVLFSPGQLRSHGIPVYRAVQRAGEFVITFPRAYHGGFSNGFNCGEAVNFAMADWLEFGCLSQQRYSLLSEPPMLHCEVLLCREALSLPLTLNSSEPHRQLYTKLAFVRHMLSLHRLLWSLASAGARAVVDCLSGAVHRCCQCSASSFLLSLDCHCVPAPVCIHHTELNQKCCCGSERTVLCHEDLDHFLSLAAFFSRQPVIAACLRTATSPLESSCAVLPPCRKGTAQDYQPWCAIVFRGEQSTSQERYFEPEGDLEAARKVLEQAVWLWRRQGVWVRGELEQAGVLLRGLHFTVSEKVRRWSRRSRRSHARSG